MNEYKSGLYKVVLVPGSATVTGKEFYAVLRQTSNLDPRIIDVKQNLLKDEAEAALKELTLNNKDNDKQNTQRQSPSKTDRKETGMASNNRR